MLDALFLFIKENPLVFLIVIAVICFLFILKQVIKWFLILLIVGGFIFFGINYVPEDGESLKDQILSHVEAKNYAPIAKFLSATSSATIKSTGNNGFIATAEGVKVEGNLKGETVKVTYKGEEYQIKLTPELKSYLESLYK